MARIIPRTWKITVDRQLGGWAEDRTASQSAAVDGKKGQYTKSTAISMFRLGRIGHIAPGETFTALSDVGTRITELPLNSAVASTGETFTVLRNGRLARWGIGDEAIDANYDPTMAAPNHAAHTIVVSENVDVIALKVGGTERIFSVWEDNTDADIMRINPDGTGQDDDWFSTLTSSGVLTKGVPHFMCQGTVDSDLYILNGQYVAKADLAGGIGTTQKLNLGEGWIGASIKRLGTFIEIIAYRSTTFVTSFAQSDCRRILWDGASPDMQFEYTIPDNFVTRVNEDSTVFSQGRNNTTKLLQFTGNAIEPYTPVVESAQIGNGPRHGGADMFEGALHFGRNGGEGLYAVYGGGLHYRCIVTNGTTQAQDIGMVKNLSSGNLFVGVKTGASTYGIWKMNPSGYYPGALFRSILLHAPYRSVITRITFWLSQFGTGASFTASLFRDYNTTSIGGANDLLNRTLTNATFGAVPTIRFPVNIYNIDDFYLNLRFDHASVTNTAAIIESIDVEGEEVIETT